LHAADQMKKNDGVPDSPVLAIASVPRQVWTPPTDLKLALERGTLFDSLYFPFFAGGETP
jgi:hypothetical protein